MLFNSIRRTTRHNSWMRTELAYVNKTQCLRLYVDPMLLAASPTALPTPITLTLPTAWLLRQLGSCKWLAASAQLICCMLVCVSAGNPILCMCVELAFFSALTLFLSLYVMHRYRLVLPHLLLLLMMPLLQLLHADLGVCACILWRWRRIRSICSLFHFLIVPFVGKTPLLLLRRHWDISKDVYFCLV